MLERVHALIQQYNLLPLDGMVVVAVSGGVDSLCLLDILRNLCGPHKAYPNVQIHVAHLDHGIRAEAGAADALAVMKLAQAWQLPYTLGKADVPALARDLHTSIEDAARIARYRFLREVAQGERIAVAHHQDDQVETLLLHWIRGGGLNSMTGLQPRQRDIIRPLLSCTRADTENYCREHNLVPVEDASNYDLRFSRNRIRHEVLPLLSKLNPGIRETLLRSAMVMQVDLAWIETQVDQQWSSLVRYEDPTRVVLDVQRLTALPLSLQRHSLRRASATLTGGQSPLELRHYQLLEELLARPATQQIFTLHLPQHLRASRRNDELLLHLSLTESKPMVIVPAQQPEGVILPIPGRVHVPGTPWIAEAELIPPTQMTTIRDALKQEDWNTVWQLLPTNKHTVYIDTNALLESEHGQTEATHAQLYDQAHHTREYIQKNTDISNRPFKVTVRTRCAGDRLRPLGMAYEKKVKDMLINHRIPQEERDQIPLFFGPHHCIWLAGVQIDDRVRLTPTTSNIVRLTIVRQ